ncbi:MFS general substrate transporter [Artomyces pyxidatus]|uniref:MFS general substrate transporter n=1 Tax=Artomyces pyxidatus TaxID=48021 RepID=A0ACB8T7K3_9AGAM|nr:MFS general substrate transporter [Artomyces pyxidatus]
MPTTHSHRVSLEQDVGEVPTADIDTMTRFGSRTTAMADPEDSAVDMGMDVPSFLSAPSNRVRRRSELAFARPSKLTLEDRAADNAAYELPELPRDFDGPPPAEAEIGKGQEVQAVDSTTPTPSLRFQSTESAALHPASIVRTPRHRRYALIHFAALCWCFFLEGWNDGSSGPLLPAIQRHYNVGFAVLSLIFVITTVGFASGAFALVYLTDKFGFGKLTIHKVMVIGSILQLIAYAIQAPAGPYPLMVFSFGVAGFGIALQARQTSDNAAANAFVGSLKTNTHRFLGFLHGSYGLGAFAAPLAATHFAQEKHWSFHYLISLGIAVSNVVVLAAVFKFKTQDEIMTEAGLETGDTGSGQGSKARQLWGLRAVHSLALFALIYVGTEVTLGGWIVTFVIRERQGGPSAGYISSGFFGGLTLGRIVLLWLNQKIGERRALFLYAAISIGLEATIWAVPSLIENAVAVSFIGLLMGPMYPILINHATKILPRWLLAGAVGVIAGVGQSGSAIVPFITGVLAAKYGISSLQPLVVAMMSVMILIWATVPKAQRRAD